MLYVYGFDMTSLKLVSSYLSNWKQRVKINDKFSSQKIISGVPQEWTESLLFDTFLCDLLIFTNDTDIENCADNNNSFKKHYGPFFWMGFNCFKATEPLRGDSLLFNTNSREIPGTHLIDPGRMKGWVDLKTAQSFWTDGPLDWEFSTLTTTPLLH